MPFPSSSSFSSIGYDLLWSSCCFGAFNIFHPNCSLCLTVQGLWNCEQCRINSEYHWYFHCCFRNIGGEAAFHWLAAMGAVVFILHVGCILWWGLKGVEGSIRHASIPCRDWSSLCSPAVLWLCLGGGSSYSACVGPAVVLLQMVQWAQEQVWTVRRDGVTSILESWINLLMHTHA